MSTQAAAIERAGARGSGGGERTRPPALWLPWRLAIVAVLLGLAAVAWVATDLRMAGMDHGPGTDPGALGFYVTTWVVMMAAMMFPSVAPMVLMHVRVQRRRREDGRPVALGATALFVAGYLVTWAAAGLVGYAVLKAGRALDGGLLAWDRGGRWAAAGVLVAAAVYELTPFKDVCLSKCRGPLTFMLESWRDGRLGGLRMGMSHGAWCVGCCWALMAALFALGAMSVAWMAVIAAVIAAEKLVPWTSVATYGATVVLAVLAVGVAAAPGSVPGLTVPADHHGMGEHGEPASKHREPMSKHAEPMPKHEEPMP